MIKNLFFILSASLLFSSCLKSSGSNTGCAYSVSGTVAPASEIATLQAYINANHPAAVQHSSGLFYEIPVPGTGTVTPGVCSTVTVRYSGYLTSGAKFDENLSGISYALGQFIVGWQKGIPLVKKGGTINLYIPPSLGYGNQQVGSIPPNSILIFYINLDNVQ